VLVCQPQDPCSADYSGRGTSDANDALARGRITGDRNDDRADQRDKRDGQRGHHNDLWCGVRRTLVVAVVPRGRQRSDECHSERCPGCNMERSREFFRGHHALSVRSLSAGAAHSAQGEGSSHGRACSRMGERALA
jgi:hypothetical protein